MNIEQRIKFTKKAIENGNGCVITPIHEKEKKKPHFCDFLQ